MRERKRKRKRKRTNLKTKIISIKQQTLDTSRESQTRQTQQMTKIRTHNQTLKNLQITKILCLPQMMNKPLPQKRKRPLLIQLFKLIAKVTKTTHNQKQRKKCHANDTNLPIFADFQEVDSLPEFQIVQDQIDTYKVSVGLLIKA